MSTKWGAEDYEKAAELCERTGSLHDNDGAYADMLRHASAALAAAAERETKLRTALRDLIDAIPDATVAADPPLECWIDAGKVALGLTPDPPRAEP